MRVAIFKDTFDGATLSFSQALISLGVQVDVFSRESQVEIPSGIAIFFPFQKSGVVKTLQFFSQFVMSSYDIAHLIFSGDQDFKFFHSLMIGFSGKSKFVISFLDRPQDALLRRFLIPILSKSKSHVTVSGVSELLWLRKLGWTSEEQVSLVPPIDFCDARGRFLEPTPTESNWFVVGEMMPMPKCFSGRPIVFSGGSDADAKTMSTAESAFAVVVFSLRGRDLSRWVSWSDATHIPLVLDLNQVEKIPEPLRRSAIVFCPLSANFLNDAEEVRQKLVARATEPFSDRVANSISRLYVQLLSR